MANEKISGLEALTSINGTEEIPVAKGGANYKIKIPRIVTPELFDAVGDGATDDTTPLQNAINSGNVVFLANKNYRITSTLQLPQGCHIMGSGEFSTISTVADITMLNVDGPAGDDSQVYLSNFTLLGDGQSNQIGFYCVATGTDFFTKNKLYNINFLELGGSGLFIGSEQISFIGCVDAVSCFAQNCGVGFNVDIKCEYNHFLDCKAFSNTVGVKIAGGNNSWVGGGIEFNDIGIQMRTGLNSGKSIFEGATMNHNVQLLDLLGVTAGVKFQGNYMVFGSWSIEDCNNVKFYNNTINTVTDTITITNCTLTEFKCNNFTTDHTLAITGDLPLWLGNTWDLGNVPAGVYESVQASLALMNSSGLYWDDPNVDGTWRLIQSGDNLVFQQREAGSYVTKSTISGA